MPIINRIKSRSDGIPHSDSRTEVVYLAAGQGSRMADSLGLGKSIPKYLLRISHISHLIRPVEKGNIGSHLTALDLQVTHFAGLGLRSQTIVTQPWYADLTQQHADFYNRELGLNLKVRTALPVDTQNLLELISYTRQEALLYGCDTVWAMADTVPVLKPSDRGLFFPTDVSAGYMMTNLYSSHRMYAMFTVPDSSDPNDMWMDLDLPVKVTNLNEAQDIQALAGYLRSLNRGDIRADEGYGFDWYRKTRLNLYHENRLLREGHSTTPELRSGGAEN
ncbi:MAG: hypothetical protein TR69_WS6001000544 [candidate division WS6 bacterium OLB20]|uniref:Uncharacterized protein n=1 Tax=candidate division WS6 bacterium OLB20 TaxID=1617426 RepID=A0A136LY10_9BACT|nr:MAG: hypothetical protein TR69_WS6001000544 [candidate division WS6 bacterium OLB20]